MGASASTLSMLALSIERRVATNMLHVRPHTPTPFAADRSGVEGAPSSWQQGPVSSEPGE